MAARNLRRSVGELAEERDDLLRSLEDLEREHAAGDVDDADYASLREQYVARAAAAVRALERAEDPGAMPLRAHRRAVGLWRTIRIAFGRRRVRIALGSVALVSFSAAVLVVAANLAGIRLPGGFSNGTVSLPNAESLQRDLVDAQVLASSGQLVSAITLYESVLRAEPNQPEALAYRGWLERLSGIAARSAPTVRAGDASIADAVRVAPHYADARGFEVIVLFEDDRAPREAAVEYQAFDAVHPSLSLLDAIGPQMALAFKDAHLAIPSGLKRFGS